MSSDHTNSTINEQGIEDKTEPKPNNPQITGLIAPNLPSPIKMNARSPNISELDFQREDSPRIDQGNCCVKI